MQYTFFKTKHIFSSDQPAKVILIDASPGRGSVHFHVNLFRISINSFLFKWFWYFQNIEIVFLFFVFTKRMLMISCLKSPSNEWVQEFIWRTELRVNWSQPWCPLHAPKLLWSRLKKAKVGHKPDPSRPEWDGTGLSVLFEKRMLHLWLVALCVHVVMWSSIRPSSHRYHGKALLHMFSVSLSLVSGSELVGFLFGIRRLWFCVGCSYDGFFFFFGLRLSLPRPLWALTKMDHESIICTASDILIHSHCFFLFTITRLKIKMYWVSMQDCTLTFPWSSLMKHFFLN